MRYQGKLYRALNPVYAREPLSGRGAELYGGRFNPKGTPALYGATSLQTAIREANQVGDLQPTTIVSYHADLEKIFDGRDPAELSRFGMSPAGLCDPTWRDQMKKAGKAQSQIFAETLIAEGFNGLLVRSFARGATDDDINLVLWRWGDTPPSRITLIDDDGRLGKS
ncbi:RES family NAD+ phosphorylase (plasmid) [Sphingobium sp. JS3065]|uniref:RES family NAD+ phosphorylase n=1 Tax=Sphingobium sp. JS3065 TaxID=2970925 RepID=UPI0022640383|nr:RES family NAD+ phosphorylase [Sphingobium sp. JS3065]UZW57980.1 RES family NAD+ phosphorylase [Sphingobium sp. JS3065]